MTYLALGCLVSLCGFAIYTAKLRVSFKTEGGVIGMVPVLDGALFGPALGWIGFALLGKGAGWAGWPWWAYVSGWCVSVLVAAWLIAQVGEWGKSVHSRTRKYSTQSR